MTDRVSDRTPLPKFAQGLNGVRHATILIWVHVLGARAPSLLRIAARPLVFAHRGGAALAPENTIAAFDNGLALGADGIELDVRAVA